MILMLLAALVQANVATDDPEETACYERDYSQQAMNQCAGDAYQRADAALNAKWAKVLAAYDDDPALKKLLLDTQRAWLKYRDGTCELAASDSVGGSIWPLINSSCLASVTRQRAKELADLVAGEGQ